MEPRRTRCNSANNVTQEETSTREAFITLCGFPSNMYIYKEAIWRGPPRTELRREEMGGRRDEHILSLEQYGLPQRPPTHSHQKHRRRPSGVDSTKA